MRRRGMRLLRVSSLLGLILAAMVAAQPASGEVVPEPEPQARKRATLVADSMTGAQVIPGPGDPDGFGTASLPNASDLGRICWDIHTNLVDVPLTGSLIHAGGPGQVGVVALQLFGEVNDPNPSGCRDADPDLLRDLNQNSREYYLEISNFPYPGGAIRGQLHVEAYADV
jgi:CHRD domain